MRIGIIGAGISGLAAAQRLKPAGHEPVVFEAAATVGGRAATEEVAGCIVDTGLQAYTPRGMSIEQAILHDFPSPDLTRIEKPIYILSHGRPGPGAPEKVAVPRFTYRTGARTFPALLSDGVEVRLNSPVEGLTKEGGLYQVDGESFDGLILTPPLGEVGRLLGTLGKSRNTGNASYRPCLSVVLVYEEELPPVPYSALLSDDRMSPVLWLGLETEKSTGRAPVGWTVLVAQLGPLYSRQHLESSEQSIVPVATSLAARLFGPRFAAPAATYVRRWVESQPERVALFGSVNPGKELVVVAGDGTLAGRAESAYESGMMAADRLIEAANPV